MINNNVMEQVTNFNYLGCHLGSDRNYYLQRNFKGSIIHAEQLNAHY